MTPGRLHGTWSLINTPIYKLSMPFLKYFETKMLRFQSADIDLNIGNPKFSQISKFLTISNGFDIHGRYYYFNLPWILLLKTKEVVYCPPLTFSIVLVANHCDEWEPKELFSVMGNLTLIRFGSNWFKCRYAVPHAHGKAPNWNISQNLPRAHRPGPLPKHLSLLLEPHLPHCHTGTLRAKLSGW